MSIKDQREEVQRILRSPQFRRAPKLQRFLELVCDYHFQNRSTEINEFVIATEAFGKGPNFNPGEDSLVRVQAREIRRRLRDYYQNDGKSSRLMLDIPNGHYAPVFTAADPPPAPALRPPSLRSAWLVLAGAVLASVAILVAADHERRLLIRTTASAAGQNTTLSGPVAGLWNRFLESDTPTLLVVSNPDVGGGCSEQKQGARGCPDEYTGMGEAVAIHLITNLFRSAKQTLIVKPSRIVNADDIQRYNLILVGGKSVNVWTRRLGEDLSIDEQAPDYETVLDAKSGQITKDRAIVALRKHPATGRWVLFLWGRHSQGTHAAAEASTDERFLAQLHWPSSPFPDSFHVLVGVRVNDGIPQRPVPAAVRIP